MRYSVKTMGFWGFGDLEVFHVSDVEFDDVDHTIDLFPVFSYSGRDFVEFPGVK